MFPGHETGLLLNQMACFLVSALQAFSCCQTRHKMASSPIRANGFTWPIVLIPFPGREPGCARNGLWIVAGGKGSGQVKAFASELLLKLHLQSNPEALCLVRATLERATELLHFQASDSRAIVRSVDEALANVLRHAYKGKRDLPIEISCWKLHDAPRYRTALPPRHRNPSRRLRCRS